jgi:hypothetical protein
MSHIKNFKFFVVALLLGLLGFGSSAQAAEPGVQYTVYKTATSQGVSYRMIVVSPSSSVCTSATIRAGIADKGYYIYWPSVDKVYVPCDGATRVVTAYAFSSEPLYDRFGLFIGGGAPYGRVASLYVP